LPEGTISLGYDAASNLTLARSYNGTSMALGYDALNRVVLSSQTLPNGYSASIGYTYDLNGNRTGMTTPWGTSATRMMRSTG